MQQIYTKFSICTKSKIYIPNTLKIYQLLDIWYLYNQLSILRYSRTVMPVKMGILLGPKEKRRYTRTAVIADIVVGEFYCTSKVRLQWMFVYPKL